MSQAESRGYRFRGLATVAALASLLTCLCVRYFVVRSHSMEPTLLDSDVVLAFRWVLRPQRDTVYSFRGPDRWLLKRLVGLPGDALALRGQTLFRNGGPVEEDYTRYLEGGIRDLPARVLGSEEYMFLGDSRDRSEDGRSLGPMDHTRIGGRVFFRVWPPSRWGPVR